MILEIEREWSKEPGWFSGLDSGQQALLLGEYRARVREHRQAAEVAKREADAHGRGKRR